MKHNNNKDILIALAVVVIMLVFLITSFARDIHRLHENGVLIYRTHSAQTK